jgi:hypothetical protein
MLLRITIIVILPIKKKSNEGEFIRENFTNKRIIITEDHRKICLATKRVAQHDANV